MVIFYIYQCRCLHLNGLPDFEKKAEPVSFSGRRLVLGCASLLGEPGNQGDGDGQYLPYPEQIHLLSSLRTHCAEYGGLPGEGDFPCVQQEGAGRAAAEGHPAGSLLRRLWHWGRMAVFIAILKRL